MISATAFLGDGERTFALHRPQLVELERRTGAGIGALSDRIASKSYSFVDLVETIRLGLIGGGASPQEAAQLVETYVDPRPIAETLPIAYAILEARFFGSSVENAPVEGEAVEKDTVQ